MRQRNQFEMAYVREFREFDRGAFKLLDFEDEERDGLHLFQYDTFVLRVSFTDQQINLAAELLCRVLNQLLEMTRWQQSGQGEYMSKLGVSWILVRLTSE